MDAQGAAIKLRGLPFEPGQVIGVLKQHPQVSDAVLGLMKDAKGRNLLVAFVVLRTTGTATASELRAFSRTRLYPQLVPDYFIIQPTIPRDDGSQPDPQEPLLVPVSTNLTEQGFQEPRDATDVLLLEIWGDLLEKVVGIDDDFFAEGGHSLLAVDLLSRIEKCTGQRLPLATMLTRSTIRSLADALVLSVAPAVEGEIIELRPGRGGRPLFFLHGDYTGGGFFSRDVAHLADPDGPFLAVPPYGLGRTRGLELPDSIAAMAATHLKAIRLRQPSGPYRLAGFCNGGMIAFEIAQQLRRAGENVEFLAMVDPPAAYATPVRSFLPATARARAAQPEAMAADAAPLTEEEYRTWLLDHYFRICAEYVASDYHGPMTVIWVARKQNDRDPDPGWSKMAKDIVVHRVDATTPCHVDAIQHNAGAVGMILHDALARLARQ